MCAREKQVIIKFGEVKVAELCVLCLKAEREMRRGEWRGLERGKGQLWFGNRKRKHEHTQSHTYTQRTRCPRSSYL